MCSFMNIDEMNMAVFKNRVREHEFKNRADNDKLMIKQTIIN